MYNDDYKRWLAADLDDPDLKPELAKIEGTDEEMRHRAPGKQPDGLEAAGLACPAMSASTNRRACSSGCSLRMPQSAPRVQTILPPGSMSRAAQTADKAHNRKNPT